MFSFINMPLLILNIFLLLSPSKAYSVSFRCPSFVKKFTEALTRKRAFSLKKEEGQSLEELKREAIDQLKQEYSERRFQETPNPKRYQAYVLLQIDVKTSKNGVYKFVTKRKERHKGYLLEEQMKDGFPSYLIRKDLEVSRITVRSDQILLFKPLDQIPTYSQEKRLDQLSSTDMDGNYLQLIKTQNWTTGHEIDRFNMIEGLFKSYETDPLTGKRTLCLGDDCFEILKDEITKYAIKGFPETNRDIPWINSNN